MNIHEIGQQQLWWWHYLSSVYITFYG